MVKLGSRTLVKGQGDSRSFHNTKESLGRFKKVTQAQVDSMVQE